MGGHALDGIGFLCVGRGHGVVLMLLLNVTGSYRYAPG